MNRSKRGHASGSNSISFNRDFAMAKGSTPFHGLLAGFGPPPPSTDDDTAYFAALGKFIVAYALAESAVHMLAGKALGVKDKKARIVFAGARLNDVATRLRSLIESRSEAVRKEVEECIQQLNAIGDRRDRFVHRLVQYNAGRLRVSNVFTAKSVALIEEEEFTIPDLRAMELDCSRIFLRLARIRNPSMKKNDTREFRKSLRAPWRYKRPPPKPMDQAGDILKRARSRKPQPRPSSA
jgi:hypothetical protein